MNINLKHIAIASAFLNLVLFFVLISPETTHSTKSNQAESLVIDLNNLPDGLEELR